jgi:A/G-specific adenine glycosylase
MEITQRLMAWYEQNARVLPWRSDTNPYKVWLSEVILQQTRINQGLPYYQKFFDEYPTIFALAAAQEEQILKLWQGLGYYSRARNMLKTAKEIAELHNGQFPTTASGLQKLTGIGPYTAAAVASICFNQAIPVLDGNAIRVYARCFGITDVIDTSAAKISLLQLAESLIDKQSPGTFNQAIMEFGALHCKPQKPFCQTCPLMHNCVAKQKGLVEVIPVKKTKTAVRQRFFLYLVISQVNNGVTECFFTKRTAEDIWKNLYDFPLIEASSPFSYDEILSALSSFAFIANTSYTINNVSASYKHQLTHQTIHAQFCRIEVMNGRLSDNKPYFAVDFSKVKDLAIPRLVDRYLVDEGIL